MWHESLHSAHVWNRAAPFKGQMPVAELRIGCERRRRAPPLNESQVGRWSVVSAATVLEVEHIEQIADRRHVGWDIGIAGGHDRVRQIVTAAAGERLQSPISLDEFQDRSVVAVAVRHPATTGER